MSLSSIVNRSYKQIFAPTRFLLRNYSETVEGQIAVDGQLDAEQQPQGPTDDDYAYNTVECKKGKIKPTHTVEEQIGYMKSKAFENAYKGLPIYKWYRRNIRLQSIFQPPPRLTCIDKDGRIKMNNACPVCRDEYLFFSYQNPELIKQFLAPGTDQLVDLLKTGLCREQYTQLKAHYLKAKEHGKLEFNVEFRVFDYRQYYSGWQNNEEVEEDEKPVTRRSTQFDAKLFSEETVMFPAHRLDGYDRFYWQRHDKFARKSK